MTHVSQARRLIVVADDFAGAADCGAAFAKHGIRTRAILDAERIDDGDWTVLDGERIDDGDWTVLALDTDSRDADPGRAAELVRRCLTGVGPRDRLFKKVDSTLRGNLAAELGALVTGRQSVCVIAAPAFPATGRTTRQGRQLLNGEPLEATEFGDQVASSVIADHLRPAGLAITEVSLADVRADRLSERVDALHRSGGGVLICDAETEDDLERVARSPASGGHEVIWLGSAGLAERLATVLIEPAPSGPACPDRAPGPLLFVIGSPAAATAAQLRRLRKVTGLKMVEVDHTEGGPELEDATGRVRDALEAGRDCLLSLRGRDGARHAGRRGTDLLAAVAAAAKAKELAGGLALSGGETARAVLGASSVTALTLAGEALPGVALGYTDGPRPVAVAVKAGGFGDEEALVDCRRALRRTEPSLGRQ